MALEILLFIVGLALVILGADFLVNGASSIARKFGLSEFVIGLTIVGMGTSAPEMVVSFIGAIEGNADIAVGNVLGSNIFNTLLILGVTCMILPMTVTKMNLRKDIPINLAATVIMLILGMTATLFGLGKNGLSRIDGMILLLLFVGYMVASFKLDSSDNNNDAEDKAKPMPIFKAILMIAAGLTGLIFGGKMFVNSATEIAKMLNVSDKLIAITILAGGTSMPELATCVVAALKKKGQLALGNVIGSNIFNILLILGGSAVIHPLSFDGISIIDVSFFAFGALAIFIFAYTFKKNQIDRIEGGILVLAEIIYMTLLIMGK